MQISATLALQIHQMLRYGIVIAMAVVLSNSAWSSGDIAAFEQLQYVGTTLSLFWINGLIQGFIARYSSAKINERNAILHQSYLLLLLCSLLLFSVLYFFSKSIAFFFTQSYLPLMELFAVYLLVSSPTLLLEYFYLIQRKNKTIVFCSGLTFIAHLFSVMGVYFFQFGIKEILLTWIWIATVRHFFLLKILLKQKNNWHFDIDLLSFSQINVYLPLIAYAFVAQYAVAYDGWLINYFYANDSEKFAIFRYGARELPLFMAFAVGLSNAMTLQIGQQGEAALGLLKAKTLRLLHGLFPFTIALLATSQYWFTLVFSKKFEAATIVFDIFLLLIISRLLFPQTILLAKKESKIIFVVSLIELLVNIVLSTVLIYFYGLAGVAFGTCIAFLSEKILLAFWLWKKHQIKFSDYTPTHWWFAYSLIILLVFYIKYN